MDKNNAMIGNYSCIRKTCKWYIKIFFHLLEEALYNAFVVYSKESKKKITKSMLFKLEVIREMLEDAHQLPADSQFDLLKGCHSLSVITTHQEQRKTTTKICCLLQKQISRRISLSLKEPSR